MADQKTQCESDLEVAGYGEFVEIGSGGFSRVYRARQFEFARPVAIKVLNNPLEDTAAAESFEQECRTMGALWDHPNIVPVYASAFTSDGRPCIVMKLFREGSYLQVLKRNGPIAVEELLLLGLKISGALAAAHDAGVIHGDVKPHNIFKSKFGEPALGDFGIATFVGRHGSNAPRGFSVHYAAPELVDGQPGPGPKADQYSLAATIFTLAVGRRPFESPDDPASNTNTEVLLRVLEAPTPRLPEVFPDRLREIIRRAMDRDPGQRFDDMGDLGEALSEVNRDLTTSQKEARSKSEESELLETQLQESEGSSQSDGDQLHRAAERRTESPKPRRTPWRRRKVGSERAHPGRVDADESVRADSSDARSESAGKVLDSVEITPADGATPSAVPAERQVFDARVCGSCRRAYPPVASSCIVCGAAFNGTNSTVASLPQSALGQLRLPGGEFEVLDTELVLGRNPASVPLAPHQRAIILGQDDRTVSRQQAILYPDGWNLKVHLLGRNSRLEHAGNVTTLEPGAVVNMHLEDTIYFGTDTWFQYVPYQCNKSDLPGGTVDRNADISTGENNLRSRMIELSNGSREIIDSDLLIGRRPEHAPLELNQRAVKHGEDDRTISRRHVELRVVDSETTFVCLGNSLALERDGTVVKVPNGESRLLEPGDILHYGANSWLRYESNDSNP